MSIDLTKPITVNGETYEPQDLGRATLLVHGVQPTDYEDYTYVAILAQHKNVKATQSGLKSGGNAQAEYRYHELADLPRFHEHKYPYLAEVVTAKTTDKKNNIVDVVLYVDFANIQEQMLVPRSQNKSASTAPVAPKV